MGKIGAFIIIAEKELIIEYYSGEIGVDDLIHAKEIISKEPNYNFSFNTVFDIRDANLKISKSDLKRLINFLNTKFGSKKRKIGYLTSKPNDVAQSILFLSMANNSQLNLNASIFSTIEGIANWFNNVDLNKDELKTTLLELKTQPNNVF